LEFAQQELISPFLGNMPFPEEMEENLIMKDDGFDVNLG
jgi:hypothetical protein